jgi:FtsH-binding integral membrane protein
MSHIEPGHQPATPPASSHRDASIDEGLRDYLLSVYNYMAGGVALSGAVAYLIYILAVTANPMDAVSLNANAVALRPGQYLTPVGYVLYATPLALVIALAPLGAVFFLSWRIQHLSPSAAQAAFWIFATLMGASLSTIFLRYSGASIAQVFFITAAAFAALSFYGYTTLRDLSGWGAFLVMGVFGILIAAVVNLVLQSSGLQFAISIVGVLVFAGLTAYDTQRIKQLYYELAGNPVVRRKAAIMGALSLYLDFINLYISLLTLFRDRE